MSETIPNGELASGEFGAQAPEAADPLLDGPVQGLALDDLPKFETVLVLGGGAMRGMAHIGVLRALRTLGLTVDAIVGTSIGSLIGAMVAGGTQVEDLERLLSALEKEDYFQLNTAKFLRKGVRAPSMYRGTTFRASLERILPKHGFDELELPFFCNAVSLESGSSVFFGVRGLRDISLVDAVYASCALPAVFEPLEWKGRHLIDGGITDAVPLRFAKLLRPKRIIAVDLTVKATQRMPEFKAHAVGTLLRSFDIVEDVLREQMLHANLDETIALIQPKVGHMHRFDFGRVEEVALAGEHAALSVLTSHPVTRELVRADWREGAVCPVEPAEYVSLHIDPELCLGCGLCEMTCATEGFSARADRATVLKAHNFECTRDHACARNCPTGAIRLGNL
ncbi:MAG: patatin-like phospholipase family protein [Planctomycetota bacterium]